ncbi:class I SAM-dependent methyltransferase [Lentibacillus sp. N15]|uniref:class I SAM-dependent methyltransferase n=1 Tax=Lentibacillus songyuanensis TaxID=3136161 RepID=UPI0031B9CB0D
MDEKDIVKQIFSKNKASYITSSTHANKQDLQEMINWLEPASEMNVLDIATGGGHVAKHLSPYVAKVTATDLTEAMLTNTASHLQAYNNITFTVADAEDLPFENDTFDIVTCRIAAHHFPNPKAFLAEVARVLTPAGKFLLIDNVAPNEPTLDHFYNTFEKMRDPSHVRARSIAEWKNMFEHQPMRMIKQTSRKKTLPFQEWAKRTLATKAEVQHVENYLMNAMKYIRNYFQIDIKKGHIQSFAIDEWMVLCKQENEQ